MASTYNDMPPRQALAAIGRDFYQKGWMAGTAGNLSVREKRETDCFWITASGLPKGGLEDNDMILVATRSGEIIDRFRDTAKPSAETTIHQAIYRLFPEAGACLHVHSVEACIATERLAANATCLWLPPLEMVKGLGIWEENPHTGLAVFDNHLDVSTIAEEIEARFAMEPPRVTALMIRNHGITVWGDDLQQAYNRVEIVEFIMSYLARRDH